LKPKALWSRSRLSKKSALAAARLANLAAMPQLALEAAPEAFHYGVVVTGVPPTLPPSLELMAFSDRWFFLPEGFARSSGVDYLRDGAWQAFPLLFFPS